MGELRHVGAHRPEQQDVLGRVRQVILAADDVADLHVGVVDADREVVERRAVGADDDQVAAERRRVDLDVAADDVVERDDPLPDAEADDRLAALGLARGALLRRQVRAAADVVRWLVGGLLGGLVGGQLLVRAVAVVGLVLGQQPVGHLPVAIEALHLAVRPERSPGRQPGDLGPLVPLEAQPVQVVEDVLLELERRAGDVGVLEAQDERAAHCAARTGS